MPRIRLSPSLLRQQAQRRLQRAKALQKALARAALSQKDSGKKGSGNGSSTKIVAQPAMSTQPTPIQTWLKAQKTGSKIMDTVRRETTYCLTGSSLFWRLAEEGLDTGSWRA